MPHDVQTGEPSVVTAGTNWEWDKELADHLPSDGWALKYVVHGPDVLEITAGDDDDTFEVREGKATTSEVAPGAYRLTGYVEKGDDRFIVYDDALRVKPDPTAAVGEKSHAAVMLEKIETRLQERAAEDVADWTRGQRAARKEEIRELQRLRGIYAAEVLDEEYPDQLPTHEVNFVAAD